MVFRHPLGGVHLHREWCQFIGSGCASLQGRGSGVNKKTALIVFVKKEGRKIAPQKALPVTTGKFCKSLQCEDGRERKTGILLAEFFI